MTVPKVANLFDGIAERAAEEEFVDLVSTPACRIERIVSTGQATAKGEWYDQDRDEWVLVLRGAARLMFADRDEALPMGPGDHVLIPAHCRHRVDWTDPDRPTVWLAVWIDREGDTR